MIRAVYDCNVIMSGIGWNGAARNCLKLVACRQVFLYITDEILAEYEAVIPETLAEEMPKIDPLSKLAWIRNKSRHVEPNPHSRHAAESVYRDHSSLFHHVHMVLVPKLLASFDTFRRTPSRRARLKLAR